MPLFSENHEGQAFLRIKSTLFCYPKAVVKIHPMAGCRCRLWSCGVWDPYIEKLEENSEMDRRAIEGSATWGLRSVAAALAPVGGALHLRSGGLPAATLEERYA
jgi:hypothetical protein